MSDVPFDGWWLAANGRWYPPETHPAFNPPGPQAAPAGWFQDDEGNWLPPHLRRPDVNLSDPALSGSPPSDPALSDPALAKTADGAEAELVETGTARDPGLRHRRKPALVAAWVMVVVLAGGIGIGYASTRDDRSPTRVDAETTIRPLLPPSTMSADDTTTTGAPTTTTTVVPTTVVPPPGP